ncbi:hypothetical protein EV639_106209 [Rathayibacter tanaceti]|uniref:Uncharacterized protein n=1 Tax=Rathayibacter tanaceti TaxID=1671680 RepID=A0ACD2XKK6_9MICO|nr:hypothetical protein EV639_106209 [Rathayibacter tanaceti]
MTVASSHAGDDVGDAGESEQRRDPAGSREPPDASSMIGSLRGIATATLASADGGATVDGGAAPGRSGWTPRERGTAAVEVTTAAVRAAVRMGQGVQDTLPTTSFPEFEQRSVLPLVAHVDGWCRYTGASVVFRARLPLMVLSLPEPSARVMTW